MPTPYDCMSRLVSVAHGSVDGSSYSYDSAGNRTAKTSVLSGLTDTYGYDVLYQLKSVLEGGRSTESYTYDAVGNRLSSLGVSPYSYNVSNQLVSTPSYTFTYDANGNMLTRTSSSGSTSYGWDYENRLALVAIPQDDGTTSTVTFQYDPFGRRIYKSSSSGTAIYAYDGANIVAEVNASGTYVAKYAQGAGIDEPLAMQRGGSTAYYNADGLGSITSLTGGTGVLASTYTYDSFGNTTATEGIHNPFRYTGREHDTETGLYYYRARYYDPTIGRFLSEDPIGFDGDGTNFYGYVRNHPTDLTDPSGFCGDCDVPAHPTGASVNQNMWLSIENGYVWWYQHVKQWNGPWDYKNFKGKPHPEWDDFGNFNYGATGCALGIPLDVLLRAAGKAKSDRLHSQKYGSPYGSYPYGNQPDKQQQVIDGYNYCKKCSLGQGVTH